MGIKSAAADDVAAGRRQRDGAAACEQRRGEQDGGTDSRAHLGIEIGRLDRLRVHAQCIRAVPLALGACGAHEFNKRLDIPNAGHVVQLYRLIGQERGGHDGQRRILIPSGTDRALETLTPFDNELDGGHALGVERGD